MRILKSGSAAAGLLVLYLFAPSATVACTGETPDLGAIVASAPLIAEVEVVEVGPDVFVDVPGSFRVGVHRVLKGVTPEVITFEYPTPVSVCDSYIANLGDRFVIAVDAKPFPAGDTMNPIWPIAMPAGTVGVRDDLALLEAMLPPGDARPSVEPREQWPELAAFILAVIAAVGGVTLIAARRDRH